MANENGALDFNGYNEEEGLNPVACHAFDHAQGMFSAFALVRTAFDLPEIDHEAAYPPPAHIKAEFPDYYFSAE